MLNVWATPTAYQALHAGNLTVGINSCFDVAASGVVDVWLVDVNQIPVRSTYVVAVVLQCALAQHNTDGVLAEGLVVSQRVLNLPLSAVSLLSRCRCVVAVVVTAQVVLSQCSTLAAPEALLSAPREVVLQVVPQLEVDAELRHELVAPAL